MGKVHMIVKNVGIMYTPRIMIVKFIKENSLMVLIAAALIIIIVATVFKNKAYEEDDKKNMNKWYPYNGWGKNPYLKCRKSKEYPYNTECKFTPVPKKTQF